MKTFLEIVGARGDAVNSVLARIRMDQVSLGINYLSYSAEFYP